jgi:O-antigen ligase
VLTSAGKAEEGSAGRGCGLRRVDFHQQLIRIREYEKVLAMTGATRRLATMLFFIMHLLAGTVLSGVLVTIVVAVPALFDMGKVAIPVAVAAGVLLAVPVAYVVARALKQPAQPAAPE